MLLSPLLIVLVIVGVLSAQLDQDPERVRARRSSSGSASCWTQPKGPGVILVFAPIDRMVRVSLRTIVMDVPPQDVITRDNVSVKVNAVVYFRVMDPRRAIVEVESYHYATSQLAQTTLRSVLGQVELDDLLSQREKLNHRPAAHPRSAHRPVGHQGVGGRSEARRSAARHAARDGAVRRKPSARSVLKSSTRKASSRRPRSSVRPPPSSPPSR